jgi:hypothetical protein
LKSIHIEINHMSDLPIEVIVAPKVFEEQRCCICLDELKSINNATLKCGHKCVHLSCYIRNPLEKCPICRNDEHKVDIEELRNHINDIAINVPSSPPQQHPVEAEGTTGCSIRIGRFPLTAIMVLIFLIIYVLYDKFLYL